MSIKGIDVSEFQGTVNWEKVKSAGYQFAMIRAGYGFGTVDKQFHRNAAECNRIGLPIGAYWFCYAISPQTAIQEAEGCLRTISGYRFDYPVSYDIEQASATYAAGMGVTYTPALTRQIVTSFCNRLENSRYFTMFYTNRHFLDTYLGSDLANRYAYWYARYTNRFDGTNCGMWQYTSEGSVPGISGNVDLDISYENFPEIIRQAGLNHLFGSGAGSSGSSGGSGSSGSSGSSGYFTYLIRPGDTLSEIALRYGTTVAAIVKLNGIKNPNLIYAGTTIKIPK